MHEVALVEDQTNIASLPEVMLVGFAENLTVGGVVFEVSSSPGVPTKAIAVFGSDLQVSLARSRLPPRPTVYAPWSKAAQRAGALKLQFADAANFDGDELSASAADERSAKVWSTIIEARALVTRGPALRIE